MADKRGSVFANELGDEGLDDSVWDSPDKTIQKSAEHTSKSTHSSEPNHENQEAKDHALRQELASVRKVNETIEGVISSLEKAKENMGVR